MSKFFLFMLLWWVVGNPFIAIILLLILFYFVDRRFVGLFPSLTRPFKISKRIGSLKQELALNPHNTSNKTELARLLMEKRKYNERKGDGPCWQN